MIATIHKNAIPVLLTLAALSVFPTNNNGVLVSAAAASRRRTKSGPNKVACGLSDTPNVVVTIGNHMTAGENSWKIIDACSGERVAKGEGLANVEVTTELCVDEQKRYKFIMLDSVGDGMQGDYTLKYDSGSGLETVADQSAFPYPGSGFEIFFGDETACCVEGEVLISGTILTDDYPKETSWKLQDTCTGDIIESGDFDANQRNYHWASEGCVPVDGKYRISISDTGTVGSSLGIATGYNDNISFNFPVNTKSPTKKSFSKYSQSPPISYQLLSMDYLGLEFSNDPTFDGCGKSKSAKKNKKTRKLKRRVLGNKQE